jgi:predicted RNA-binding Zn-ribbon protein involved in translation (DUF1610 family)
MTLDQASSDARCDSCGFEAPSASDEWGTAEHPPLGTVSQCPECGSTNIHTR